MISALPRIDYRSHPAYGGMFAPEPAMRDQALAILEPLVAEMAEVEAQRVGRFGYNYGSVNRQGEELAERGVTQLQLPDELMDPVHAGARPVIQTVQARIGQTRGAGKSIRFKTVEEKLSPDAHAELWRAVDEFLKEMAIYDTVTAFYGAKSARINSLALFVNPPSQDWASTLFRDLDITPPPTAGFHIDSNGKCYIKGILHLSAVGPEQGPTGVVPGSHLWGRGSQDRIYRRAFDRSPMLARSADARRLFVSLPEEMQVKAEFGGDMDGGSPEAEALVASEVRAIGPKGFLSLFDPETVHRGGNVRSGERHALQLVLTAQY
jgi:hypothetical protein